MLLAYYVVPMETDENKELEAKIRARGTRVEELAYQLKAERLLLKHDVLDALKLGWSERQCERVSGVTLLTIRRWRGKVN